MVDQSMGQTLMEKGHQRSHGAHDRQSVTAITMVPFTFADKLPDKQVASSIAIKSLIAPTFSSGSARDPW